MVKGKFCLFFVLFCIPQTVHKWTYVAFTFFLVAPWGMRRRQWQPTPVLLPGKSHGWRRLVGCSPLGQEDRTWLSDFTFNFHFSCIGEGNGNPLQCSCLENPRDGGAWWAAVYGVPQSWTRLQRLSSSSSSWWNRVVVAEAGVAVAISFSFFNFLK